MRPSESEFPLVSIVIPNYNGKSILRKCLKRLLAKTNYPNLKIIVVDDGSTDSSSEMVKKEFPSVILLRNRKNVGFTKSSNIGWKYAFDNLNSKYVVIFNNDIMIFQRNWLTKLIKALQLPHVGVVAPQLISQEEKIQHVGYSYEPSMYLGLDLLRKKRMEKNSIWEVDAVMCPMIIRREVTERIGLFDEVFSPFYSEDHDYCFRAKKAGWKILYVGNVKCIHYGSYTLRRLMKSKKMFISYLQKRNNFIFLWRYFPKSPLFVLALFYSLITSIVAPRDTSQPMFPRNFKLKRNCYREILMVNTALKEAYRLKDIHLIPHLSKN